MTFKKLSLSFLFEPYPLMPTSGIMRMSLVYGLFVFVFLFVFQPFGLAFEDSFPLLKICGTYGVITTAVTYSISWSARKIFPHFFHEKHWVFGRELFMTMIIVSAIGFFNLLYSSIRFNHILLAQDFFTFQFYTLAVGIIPISIIMLLRMQRLTKINAEEASSIAEHLGGSMSNISKEDYVTITTDLKGEDYNVKVEDLIYIESADNYVKIVSRENQSLNEKLLRTTMTKVESDTVNIESLIRCHRGFLVNLSHINSCTGNAQGLLLGLNHVQERIPVSRKMVSEVRDRLK